MSNLDKQIELNRKADKYLEEYNEKANGVLLAIIPIVVILAIVTVPIVGVIHLLSGLF
jgi:hypothetical protein